MLHYAEDFQLSFNRFYVFGEKKGLDGILAAFQIQCLLLNWKARRNQIPSCQSNLEYRSILNDFTRAHNAMLSL